MYTSLHRYIKLDAVNPGSLHQEYAHKPNSQPVIAFVLDQWPCLFQQNMARLLNTKSQLPLCRCLAAVL